MTQSFDKRFSRQLFELTKNSWVLRHAAVFAASDLIWFMMGAFYGYLVWDELFLEHSVILPALYIAIALLGAYVITMVISKLANRPRPYKAGGYEPLLKPFIETASFPSAHATFVFALASLAYSNEQLFPYVFVGAIIVAFGRVMIGVHYLSDILMGAAIGLLFGKATQIAILLALTFIN